MLNLRFGNIQQQVGLLGRDEIAPALAGLDLHAHAAARDEAEGAPHIVTEAPAPKTREKIRRFFNAFDVLPTQPLPDQRKAKGNTGPWS